MIIRRLLSKEIKNIATYIAIKPAELFCSYTDKFQHKSLPKFLIASAVSSIVTLPITAPMFILAVYLDNK